MMRLAFRGRLPTNVGRVGSPFARRPDTLHWHPTTPFGGSRPPPVVSFKDRNTRLFFEGERVRAFRKFADQAVRRLTLLDRTDALDDLAVLPGNRLEALPGERAGQHSIRINAERRICFRWASDGPHDVEIVDDRSVGEGRGP